MADENPLQELLIDELKDLYSAENQIIKALPRLARAASTPQLRRAFEQHLRETRGQVKRLDRIGRMLEVKLTGKKCHGMAGLIDEGREIIQDGFEESALDAGLIGAAQKVEHYEIAAYGCLCTYAEMLGYDEAHELLGETLDEEETTDERLTALAESVINVDAEEGSEEETETSR